jgi:predicted nucleic acid-binding protein
MSVRSFFDTNVLVYTDDHDNPDKQAKALDLLAAHREHHRGVLSSQVLQEYFATVVRKYGVPAEIARSKVERFARFDLVLISLPDILAAIDLHRLHQLSFWDALIVRCALQSRCSVLYSEDLQTGRRIDGVEIVNPFV